MLNRSQRLSRNEVLAIACMRQLTLEGLIWIWQTNVPLSLKKQWWTGILRWAHFYAVWYAWKFLLAVFVLWYFLMSPCLKRNTLIAASNHRFNVCRYFALGSYFVFKKSNIARSRVHFNLFGSDNCLWKFWQTRECFAHLSGRAFAVYIYLTHAKVFLQNYSGRK